MSVLNILLGIWFFVSPWVFGAARNPTAWNAWIVGALLVIFGAISAASAEGFKPLSWVNMILGIWIFASPWIYQYITDTGRFVNSLCVGVVVFLVSLTAWMSHSHPTPQPH